MHIRDKELIVQINQYFAVGNIRETSTRIYYSVRSIKDHLVIESHSKKCPLQTKKGADFILFSKALNIMINKGHLYLSEVGFKKL